MVILICNRNKGNILDFSFLEKSVKIIIPSAAAAQNKLPAAVG